MPGESSLEDPALAGLPLAGGATGEAARDLQRRLTGAGHAIELTEAGRYGPSTETAVSRFQADRGLHVDGVCGPQTWSALVEAGYRLGDRLLYQRAPMMRGDDIGELQLRLGSLGFDTGRVDAIFGPATTRAVADFQRNAGLTTDGICGPDSLAALRRLVEGPPTSSVAGVREREAMRGAPRRLHDRRVVVGETGGLDALAAALGRALGDLGATVAVVHHPDGSAHAADANGFDAAAYLGLALVDEEGCRAAHYATTGFESTGGRHLAELAVGELADLLGATEVRGMRLPVLRETRMPAVICELGPPDRVVEHGAAVATALSRAVARWAVDPVEP